MSIKQTSLVWEFFAEKGDLVICSKCPKSYKLATAKSSTQPLLYHLKTKHGDDFNNAEMAMSSKRAAENQYHPPSKKQRNLFSYVEKKTQVTQQQMYAELAAVDRLSFQQISGSNFIRSSMVKQGLPSHTSSTTVGQKVFQYYDEAKDIMIDHLQKKIKENCRFALSFDEYTGKNRRYLTINVHSDNGVSYNLGMVRVWSSQTAETVLKLVELRLADFKMNFTHIAAMVTDGASIMVKLGRLAPCEHVICLSHTLHLVITDVFYPKKSDSGEDIDEEVSETISSDDSSEDEDEEDEATSLPAPTRNGNPRSLAPTIGSVVKKVRAIIQKFRSSPVRNDLLQVEVKKKYGKELRVILDCKTRWTSLHSMTERFLLLEDPLNKLLDDLGLEQLKLSSNEIQLLRDIVAALEPFKVATEFLCKRKCTLVEAEKIIIFTASELRKLGSELSKNLLHSLETRYLNRRNSNVVSLAKFFVNPDSLTDTENTYKMPSKAIITKNAKALNQHLFPENVESSELKCKIEPEEEEIITPLPSMAKQLSDFLKQQSSGKCTEVQDTFSREIGLFIAGKNRQHSYNCFTKHLKQFLQHQLRLSVCFQLVVYS